jgi:polyferredoxin
MIQEELQQLSTTPRDLRKFGLLVGGVFLLLGGWFLYRQKVLWPYFLTPGALLFLFGAIAPRGLKIPYLAWMGLAFTLGLIVTTVLLSVFYFVVMTPFGLLARAFGRDFLSRKFDPQAASYWIARKRPASRNPADYERQF